MTSLPIGNQIKVLDIVDSSNNYAMALAKSGAARHGNVYFAMQQTAGKGQRGKQWITEYGVNLMQSIVLETNELRAADLFALSTTVALGVHDWFSAKAGDETRLKWPNDVYWRDRKAGGILIENGWAGDRWQFAIAGMGINLNQRQFDPAVKNPVSLLQITGQTYDLLGEAAVLCGYLETRWQQLLAGGQAQLHADFERVLYKKGEKVRLKKGNRVFETRVEGVSQQGELITRDALEHRFAVGSVEWLP
ncbi:MAG: biotin--[acetyl-CoA-carboxylase] ligase [Bacteroidetes bacterium]|nr:biotin--[acetyl-CoA-carboxylase] ligase [Bacteroidota bacterium]